MISFKDYLTEKKKDPCWTGYEMVGMKDKGGKKVPNCVPVKEENELDEAATADAKGHMSATRGFTQISRDA